MTWLPWDAVKQGGGWAVLLLLAVAFLFARSRGILLTEKDVDRSISGYKEVIELYKIQLAQKDTAITYERERSDRLDRQVEKLLVHAETTTHIITELREEARKR
jgi:hypothetical protein